MSTDANTLIAKVIEEEASEQECQELHDLMASDPLVRQQFEETLSAAEDVRFAVAVANAEAGATVDVSDETTRRMEALFSTGSETSAPEPGTSKLIAFPFKPLLATAAALALFAGLYHSFSGGPSLSENAIASLLRNQATVQHMGPQMPDKGDVVLSFEFVDGSPEIASKRSLAQLAILAAVMNSEEFQGQKFTVTNHTDSEATSQANLELSKKRARWVVDRLSSDYQVSTTRLTAVGKGDFEPPLKDAPTNRTVIRREG